MSDQELLSLSEAAKKYTIPMTTIRDALRRGEIEGRKIGSQWVVTSQSVESFLQNRPKKGRPFAKKS